MEKNEEGKTGRKDCQIHKAESGSKKREKQTSWWCQTCKVPVCLEDCYDKHLQYSLLKKFKLNFDVWGKVYIFEFSKKKTESIDRKFIGELLRKYLDELIWTPNIKELKELRSEKQTC